MAMAKGDQGTRVGVDVAERGRCFIGEEDVRPFVAI